MVKSCGILIHCQGKYLICKSSGFYVYGIPKGRQEVGETDKQTAIREVKEETNLEFKEDDLVEFLKYKTKLKEVVCFYTDIKDFPKNIKCNSILDSGKPEVDGFIWCTKKEALLKINNHMKLIFEKLQ